MNQEMQLDYDYEKSIMITSKESGCCSRRKLIIAGLVGLVVVIGAATGTWLAFKGRSTDNASSSQSFENNLIPSPTPVSIHYGGRPTASPGPTSSRAYLIADIIDDIARNGGEEFKDTGSYQSLAKKWVLTQDFPVQDGSSLTTQQQATQLYALACIFYSTFSVRSSWTDANYGPDVALPGWYSSRGWLGKAEDVCSNWHGLTCNDEGRVSHIQLDTNGLTGALPPETALLHETLHTIDLYKNPIHNVGEDGNSFFGELTNLEYLYLGSTSVQYDGVPPAFGKLTKLKELDFGNSLYFGKLDGAIFEDLTELKYLVMEGNMYNSPIPSELAGLPNLEYLYAAEAWIEGGLDFMTTMPKIREIWLDDNPNLKGTIPSGIGNMKHLASFGVANCGLTGSIPPEIGGATNMLQMWLNDNKLSGNIPAELSNLVMMQSLSVQDNKLNGEMPAGVCKNKRPFGSLEELGADCDGAIFCAEECCTCCGDQCN